MKLNSVMESQFELGLSESAVHSQYPPHTPGSDVIEYQGSRFFNEGRHRRLCSQWSTGSSLSSWLTFWMFRMWEKMDGNTATSLHECPCQALPLPLCYRHTGNKNWIQIRFTQHTHTYDDDSLRKPYSLLCELGESSGIINQSWEEGGTRQTFDNYEWASKS